MALPSLLVAALPPPPVPESAGGDGGSAWPSLVAFAAGLAFALLVAFAAGVLVGRGRIAGRGRQRPDSVVCRIELWHDGTAVVLGYTAEPAAGDPTFAVHLARARAEGTPGALVLIDPITDAIVTLHPILPEAALPASLCAVGAGEGSAKC